MTPHANRQAPKWLREAAAVASDEGVVIVVEVGARVYRIAPSANAFPVTASEKDSAECDEAFG